MFLRAKREIDTFPSRVCPEVYIRISREYAASAPDDFRLVAVSRDVFSARDSRRTIILCRVDIYGATSARALLS